MKLRIAGCFLLCAAAFGQGDRGTITGTVTDKTGAVIPNATVEITNQDTQAERAVSISLAGKTGGLFAVRPWIADRPPLSTDWYRWFCFSQREPRIGQIPRENERVFGPKPSDIIPGAQDGVKF